MNLFITTLSIIISIVISIFIPSKAFSEGPATSVNYEDISTIADIVGTKYDSFKCPKGMKLSKDYRGTNAKGLNLLFLELTCSSSNKSSEIHLMASPSGSIFLADYTVKKSTSCTAAELLKSPASKNLMRDYTTNRMQNQRVIYRSADRMDILNMGGYAVDTGVVCKIGEVYYNAAAYGATEPFGNSQGSKGNTALFMWLISNIETSWIPLKKYGILNKDSLLKAYQLDMQYGILAPGYQKRIKEIQAGLSKNSPEGLKLFEELLAANTELSNVQKYIDIKLK